MLAYRPCAPFRRTDQFNWALDWFDAELAGGARGDELALKIVGEESADLTFLKSALRDRFAL